MVVGVGLVLYGYLSRSTQQVGQPTNSDIVQSPVPTPTLAPVSTEEPFLGLHGIKTPATCQLEAR